MSKKKINLMELFRLSLLWNLGLIIIATISWYGGVPALWGVLAFNACYIVTIYFSFIRGNIPRAKGKGKK